MKKQYIMSAFAAALLLGACQSSPLKNEEGSSALSFVAGELTRTAFSTDLTSLSWTEGDRVGIFASRDGASEGVNYPYEVRGAEGGPAKLSAVSSQWQYSYEAASGSTFTAYYPFAGTAGEGNRFVVPVSVPSQQAQKAAGDPSHLSSYMVLKSAPAAASEAFGEVNLHFRNLTAVVEIEVKAGASNGFRISSAVLAADAPLSFDRGNLLLEGVPSGDGSSFQINDAQDTVALSLASPFALETSGSKLYFTVVPGTHEAASVKLRLCTENGYVCETAIPEGVTFEGNGVYRKTVTVDPSDFVPSAGPSGYTWKEIASAADISEGEYIISYDFSYGDHSGVFLLPCTPVDRNPVPAEMFSGVFANPDGYVWTVSSSTGGWNISFSSAGTRYYLAGCDKAQGLAVSSDGKGYYSPDAAYGTVWTFTGTSDMQLSTSVSSRRAMPWIDPANGLDHFEWRMAKSDTGGFVLYKKTLAE